MNIERQALEQLVTSSGVDAFNQLINDIFDGWINAGG